MSPMFLKTTVGFMPAVLLERSEEEERVPCGRAVTTTWRWRGQVVKRDVVIYADKMPGVLTNVGGSR